MSNHLESAGKSLKKSASNLTIIIIITLISLVLGFLVFDEESIDSKTKSFLLFGIIGIGSIINLILHFSFIGNLRDTGQYLLITSEVIETKSSEQSTPTKYKKPESLSEKLGLIY